MDVSLLQFGTHADPNRTQKQTHSSRLVHSRKRRRPAALIYSHVHVSPNPWYLGKCTGVVDANHVLGGESAAPTDHHLVSHHPLQDEIPQSCPLTFMRAHHVFDREHDASNITRQTLVTQFSNCHCTRDVRVALSSPPTQFPTAFKVQYAEFIH